MGSKDLNFIKKNYGEQFMHFCRSAFPTLLEQEGALPTLLSSYFAPTKHLFEELQRQNKFDELKQYIYALFGYEQNQKVLKQVSKSPEQLMDEAGYILYPECKVEADIQRFAPLYTPKELLCTFLGNRLDSCRVWFAVKKNVQEIKRENFKNPKREDEYGTSVISIQFSRVGNILSIKNRYNHTVKNPDCTFQNNLDNIIEGLTKSFDMFYGTARNIAKIGKFSLKNFVLGDDGKLYYVTKKVYDVIYCAENNVAIANGRAIYFNKDKYVFADNYVISLDEKVLFTYARNGIRQFDAFTTSMGHGISNIRVEKTSNGNKNIIFSCFGTQDEIIQIDKKCQIVKYQNPNIDYIGDNFLPYNSTLKELDLPNVKSVGDDFLKHNNSLEYLSLPSAKRIGQMFMAENTCLKQLDFPKVEKIMHGFLSANLALENLTLPNVEIIMYGFMFQNEKLSSFEAPNLKVLGSSACYCNQALSNLHFEKLEQLDDDCFHNNATISSFVMPNLKVIGDDVMYYNNKLEALSLPNINKIGYSFLACNKCLKKFSAPNVETIGVNFLSEENKFAKKIRQEISTNEMVK